MFKKLEIRNFQSHKHSVLEFHPGMNVIIGKTDSGKSAVIRSLKLAIKNRPSGDAFISHWADEAHVVLSTDNNVIERKKGKQNKFILDKQELTGFSQSVPEEVEQALNLSDASCQFQMDDIFLLNSSSGEVAAYFNKVANLDMIDKGQSNIKKWISGLSRDIESTKQIIKDNREKVKLYKFLEDFEIQLDVIEQDKKQLDSNYKTIQSLQKTVEKVHEIQDLLEENKHVVSLQTLVTKTIALHKTCQDKKAVIETLQTTIERVKTVNESIQEHKEIAGLQKVVDKSITLFTEIKDKKKQITALETLLEKNVSFSKTLKQKKQQHKELHEKYDRLFPDVCPLCGTPKK
jgi:exonuclease SbcC